MATILVCDHCRQEIINGYNSFDLVKIEAVTDGHIVRKMLHRDCFNYIFSTDIEKIKELK